MLRGPQSCPGALPLCCAPPHRHWLRHARTATQKGALGALGGGPTRPARPPALRRRLTAGGNKKAAQAWLLAVGIKAGQRLSAVTDKSSTQLDYIYPDADEPDGML